MKYKKLQNVSSNSFEFVFENESDLWISKKIIEKNDLISSWTKRHVIIQNKSQETIKLPKKSVYLTILCEKIKFIGSRGPNSPSILQITGKIQNSQDHSGYHTIEVMIGTKIKILKNVLTPLFDYWLGVSTTTKNSESLIFVCISHNHLELFQVFPYSIKKTKSYEFKETGKYYSNKKSFLSECYKIIQKIENKFVIIGPGFIKNDFIRKYNVSPWKIYDTQGEGYSGCKEILKKDPHLLERFRTSEDERIMEKILNLLRTDESKVCYSLSEVNKNLFRAKVVYIQESISNEENVLELLNKIIENKISFRIFLNSSLPGENLNSLGGVVSICY